MAFGATAGGIGGEMVRDLVLASIGKFLVPLTPSDLAAKGLRPTAAVAGRGKRPNSGRISS
jgi:hypothetical protein